MAIKETNKELAATLAAKEKADAESRAKAEAIEGATYPSPYTAYEARVVALEAAIKKLTDRLDAAVLTPLSHDNRLDALEKTVRAQQSDVVARAEAMSAAAMPKKVK